MSTLKAFDVQKTERRSRGYWAPDAARAAALWAAVYRGGAPAGSWRFEIKRQVKCSSGTPALKFDALTPEAIMFTGNVRAETGSDARFEVTLYHEGAKMPPFNRENLTYAATVYSALADNLKQRRLAMGALPNGIVFSRLTSEMGAGLLVALGLDSKVPVDIVLRGLVVEGDLCEVAPLAYAAVRPNKVRLRADIEGLKPETLTTLRQLLAAVEKKGIDGQKREPTILSRSETGLADEALLRLQQQVPGIVFLGTEDVQVFDPICELAATIVASLGQKISLPSDEVEAAEQRVTLAVAEYERLQKELDRIGATHPDLETKLDESTRLRERLETELVAVRDVLKGLTETFEAKQRQLLATRQALEAAESEAMDAMADQDAIKERQVQRRESDAALQLKERLEALSAEFKVTPERLLALVSAAP